MSFVFIPFSKMPHLKKMILKSSVNLSNLFIAGFILLFSSAAISAQTLLINPAGDGGFESGPTFSENNWVAVNSFFWMLSSMELPRMEVWHLVLIALQLYWWVLNPFGMS